MNELTGAGMRILFVDSQFPMPDRASVDVRLWAMIRLLLDDGHACSYFAAHSAAQERSIGSDSVAAYRGALQRLGVVTYERMAWEKVLTSARFDVVIFKYFYAAEGRLDLLRIWQPWARAVIDSNDLVHARLRAKAQLTGDPAHLQAAIETEKRELAAYSTADAVIAITEDESAVLGTRLPGVPLAIIPNIHAIPSAGRDESKHPALVFVGVFSHEPNVDAVLHFHRAIWPKITSSVPGVRCTIVGGNPPGDILTLRGDNVEVTGHVPDTLPYLLRSWVSIAPLRFGAGMKGKIGEAMAAGVPVVTTPVGAQGLKASIGSDLFVEEDAEGFARRVVQLLGDAPLRSRVGAAGRAFIENHYSPQAVRERLRALIGQLEALEPKSMPLRGPRLLLRAGRLSLQRHVLWRFQA